MKTLRLILAAAIALGATGSLAADKTPLANYSGIVGPIQSGDAVPVTRGGTGQTTYTDGQLVIGDSSSNGLDKSTITAGSGVTITNGHGTITLSASGTGSTRSYEAKGAVPVTGSFTWTNQGTATVTDSTNGVFMQSATTGSNLRIQEMAAPSTPFDLYVRVMENGGNIGTNSQLGIFLRDSTNGRVIFWGFNHASGSSLPQLLAQRWTSPSAFNTGIIAGSTSVSPTSWLRVNVTSTTITFYASSDGYNWVNWGTETISTFLTASGGGSLDMQGWGANANNNANVSAILNVFQNTQP